MNNQDKFEIEGRVFLPSPATIIEDSKYPVALCEGCDFVDTNERCRFPKSTPRCSAQFRDDGRNIIWKEQV